MRLAGGFKNSGRTHQPLTQACGRLSMKKPPSQRLAPLRRFSIDDENADRKYSYCKAADEICMSANPEAFEFLRKSAYGHVQRQRSSCTSHALPGRTGCVAVFAIGDVACHSVDGKPQPGLAPVAKQQGKYVGNLIRSRIDGGKATGIFRYRNWGTMAVIGRSKAVADFGWLKVGGFTAWVLWSAVHLWLLVSFRSRLTVYTNWAWAWRTRGRGARLLTKAQATSSGNGRPVANTPD